MNNIDASKTSSKKIIVAIIEKTSNRRNTIVVEFNTRKKWANESKRGVNFAVKNEGVEELNKDAKVGLIV